MQLSAYEQAIVLKPDFVEASITIEARIAETQSTYDRSNT